MSEATRPRISVDLTGRVALVTGAGRGLGRTIAQSLAASGASLACVDVDADALAETVDAVRSGGSRAEAFTCDVTDSGRVNEVVDQVVKQMGRLDILVNNAGITRDGMIMRMKDDQWDAVLAINLRGTFLFTRAAARPMMKARGGRIINIASVSGLMGNPGQANYSASKAGVIGLTRTVARELASRNITVNAIAPGFIATEMTAKLGEEILAQVQKEIPLGRLGEPQDVADAVLYLAGDAAEFITGHVLTVDGGLTV
ncbi:MAG: 3-oxoacyl-[acyl-carrier-protein] reductase [Thermoguttaceae bacterium]|jgi:3-oxoacyl-[acyl-carrier protein] reductase|nr:3-oxoacyl-[acyl-carrier-protein] reductase [Thermoguttaceae bacterium]